MVITLSLSLGVGSLGLIEMHTSLGHTHGWEGWRSRGWLDIIPFEFKDLESLCPGIPSPYTFIEETICREHLRQLNAVQLHADDLALQSCSIFKNGRHVLRRNIRNRSVYVGP